MSGSAMAVPVVPPPVPPVVPSGFFAGIECVTTTGEGPTFTLHGTFFGTFSGVPFVESEELGLFTWTSSSTTPVSTQPSTGTWVMAKGTDISTRISGTLQTIGTPGGFVSHLTVTGGSGDAVGVSGQIQLFGTTTLAAPQEGCFLNLVKSGYMFTALKQRLIR
jgi:hypothetical protein